MFELSAREWGWLCWSLVLLPLAALSIRYSGWQVTMQRFRRLTRRARVERNPSVQLKTARAAARIVRIAATYGPARPKCLPRAVVLWALLERDGVDVQVELGVRQGDCGVEAHAWVALDGVALDRNDRQPFVALRPVSVP